MWPLAKKTPELITFFRKLVRRLKRLNNNRPSLYSNFIGDERFLSVLKFGSGNCAAWSSLFSYMAIMFGFDATVIDIRQKGCSVTRCRGHAITLVQIGQDVWCQSNCEVTPVDDLSQAIKYTARVMGWKRGGYLRKYRIIRAFKGS